MRKSRILILSITMLVLMFMFVLPAAAQLNYGSSPNSGSINLSAGFSPDPHTRAITSGGSVSVSALNLGSGCTGYATSAPDYRVNWSGTSSRLRFFFVANPGQTTTDTTMIVNMNNGQWRCNDDSAGTLNPSVDIANPGAGQYDIWIGSYSSGAFVSGTLYVTELSYDPANHP